MIYDSIIIGTGPAGLSAALNLKIHEKNFLWIGSPSFSDKVRKAELIRNYPGLTDVTGQDMAESFRAQADAMGLSIHDAMVTSIIPMGNRYAVMAQENFFETKSLILSTGVAAVGTIPGEPELLGRGVSYCATCDGGLYRNRTIAVVCSSPRFEHEVKYLANLASTVYFFPTYKNPGDLGPNVQTVPSRPVRVLGDQKVTGVEFKDGTQLPLDGIFCLRDSISLASLLPGLGTGNGHIAVDRHMATNLPGVFAAGDCTGRPYQYVKAAGEGNVAAHSVIEYLAELEANK